MAYEIVKTLKCIDNKLSDNVRKANLTIGEIYDSAFANSPPDSDSFGVYDDNGELYSFNKRYFEIASTANRENTGWNIQCDDCGKKVSIKELIENNYKCPICNQEFITLSQILKAKN